MGASYPIPLIAANKLPISTYKMMFKFTTLLTTGVLAAERSPALDPIDFTAPFTKKQPCKDNKKATKTLIETPKAPETMRVLSQEAEQSSWPDWVSQTWNDVSDGVTDAWNS